MDPKFDALSSETDAFSPSLISFGAPNGMPPMLCAYNAATTALPPALMHQSFHQFYGTGAAASPAAASAFPPQMSASISGALPPDPTHQLMMGRHLQQQQQQLFGNGGAFAVSNRSNFWHWHFWMSWTIGHMDQFYGPFRTHIGHSEFLYIYGFSNHF